MKKLICTYVFTALLVCMAMQVNAQKKIRPTPGWVSEKGYWIVETNIYQPRHSIVRFYTNDHVLAGSKEINDRKLKLRKARTKIELTVMLETYLSAWSAGKAMTDSGVAKSSAILR